MRSRFFALAMLSWGCSHVSITASELDRVDRPAFVARFEEDGGPHAHVFRDDAHWVEVLRKREAAARKGSHMSTSEADAKLAEHLEHGRTDPRSKAFEPAITRFEVADGVRANTVSLLPKEPPWTATVPPGQVSRALESLLTQEVPAKPPDFELLRPLGVDAVVEIVIEDYGLRSEGGRAGCYMTGYGRMFMLDGGGNMWFRAFRADEVASGQDSLDPFQVNAHPHLFREHMSALVKAVAEQFAEDLQPPRGPGPRPEPKPKPAEEGGTPEQQPSGEDLP